MKKIQIIDLFAGPGGLSEGFSNFSVDKKQPFKTAISIEKDKFAYQTLLLRSFVRQFNKPPSKYYTFLKGEITKEKLYQSYPNEFSSAKQEVCQAELGSSAFTHEKMVTLIDSRLEKNDEFYETIIIGGPPCQAYSLAGRSKMQNNKGFNDDPRHTLYLEYLKYLVDFQPLVFVMENVKGMLSSKLNGEPIFERILADLRDPASAVATNKTSKGYTLYSLVVHNQPDELLWKDFVVKSEDYGIPQARHRVIILGVRNDCGEIPNILTKQKTRVSVKDVISDLPKLRSGLSKMPDSFDNWEEAIRSRFPKAKLWKNLNRGAPFIKSNRVPRKLSDWFIDPFLAGVLDHETRSHIASDLHRYYYIADYGADHNVSLKLENLPASILPNHKNVNLAIDKKSLFNDRFRVQLGKKPSTTITSHISKDGHYFIHYDKRQCRSLSVREAARLQTFPDNYKFEGPRTAQYHQVGNAVPPLLAHKIAGVVYELVQQHWNQVNKDVE